MYLVFDRLGPRPKLKAKTWAKAYHYIRIKTPPTTTTHHHRNFSEGSWHRRRLGFGISILQDQNRRIQLPPPPLQPSPLLVNPFVYERTHDHLELFRSNLNQTLKERSIPTRLSFEVFSLGKTLDFFQSKFFFEPKILD